MYGTAVLPKDPFHLVKAGTLTKLPVIVGDQTLRERLAANTRTYVYEFAEKDGPPFTSIWRLHTDYPFGATYVNGSQVDSDRPRLG